ncbi:MAG: hypothetical protein KKF50_00325 [Nanoarchaeota archaeon]|nr:hypothetical protein [Nanoarchaeota archaeon]
MVDRTKNIGYSTISPGTIGVSQRIFEDYLRGEAGFGNESGGLVYLTKNDIMPCGQNQY